MKNQLHSHRYRLSYSHLLISPFQYKLDLGTILFNMHTHKSEHMLRL